MCEFCENIKEVSEKEKEYRSAGMKLAVYVGDKRKFYCMIAEKRGHIGVLYCPICGRDLRSENGI